MKSSSNEACSNIEIDIQTYVFSFFKGKQRTKGSPNTVYSWS